MVYADLLSGVAERFWVKVDKTSHPDGCWVWSGALNKDGYGHFRITTPTKRTMLKAHKVAYLLVKGEPKPGNHLHHVCEHKYCVNPDHLEELTPKEHAAKSPRPGPGHRRMVCAEGQGIVGDNDLVLPNGTHQCLRCIEEHQEKYGTINGTNQFSDKHKVTG